MASRDRDFDRWVRLRIDLTPDGVGLLCRDETGWSQRFDVRFDLPPLPPAPLPQPSWPFPIAPSYSSLLARFVALAPGLLADARPVRIPPEALARIREAFDEFTGTRLHRLPDHGSLPVPWLLPVFVEPPAGLDGLPWDEWAQRSVLGPNGLGERCVAVAYRPSTPAPDPLELPLKLHDGAFEGEDTLRRLRGEGATVQFVRHTSVLSMPWHLVCDFQLRSGDAYRTPRICRATDPVKGDFPQPGEAGCRHFPGQDVACVEGFWAYRHRLELISEELGERDACAGAQLRASEVEALSPHPLLTFGASLDPALTSAVEDDWQAALAHRYRRLGPDDVPIPDGLWKPELQPAMLVLLGHLHEADEDARDFYRAQLSSGAGTPMLFTAYGNADLQVRKGETA